MLHKTIAKIHKFHPGIVPVLALVLAIVGIFIFGFGANNYIKSSNYQIDRLKVANEKINNELNALKNEDQVVKNKTLEENIKNIEKTYGESVKVYENIINLRDQKRNTSEYEKLLVAALSQLSKRDYSSASSTLSQINTKIAADNAKLAATAAVGNTANVAVNNTAPGSGYSRQKVKTDFGEFIVDIVAADLGSTRVIVDTAADGDCRDNCPVLSLGDYVGSVNV